jgi:hypothetical protein
VVAEGPWKAPEGGAARQVKTKGNESGRGKKAQHYEKDVF